MFLPGTIIDDRFRLSIVEEDRIAFVITVDKIGRAKVQWKDGSGGFILGGFHYFNDAVPYTDIFV